MTNVSSARFDALASKVGRRRLAGWITQHNPKVKARADATRKKHRKSALTRRAPK